MKQVEKPEVIKKIEEIIKDDLDNENVIIISETLFYSSYNNMTTVGFLELHKAIIHDGLLSEIKNVNYEKRGIH
jgi:hypothetical protein